MSSFHKTRCGKSVNSKCRETKKKREGENGDGGETWLDPTDTHQHLLKGHLVYVVNKGLMRDQRHT